MSLYGHELEFGVFPTPTAADSERVVALTRRAETAGLDLVSFQDHPYQPRFLDTWTLLSYVAAATSRIVLATNVLNLPLRQPAVVARSVASLDLLSGGRIELGIGTGAFWDAIEAMGGEKLTPGQGVDALTEAIEVIRAIWDADERSGVRLDGEHYKLSGAKRGPAPAHDVSIWVGAYKPRMLELTGRAGDGWLPSVPYMGPGDLAEGNERIDAAAEAARRAPDAIRRLLNVGGSYSDGSRGPLTGPPASWAEEIAELASKHGVSTFIAMADDPGTIESLAEAGAGARELLAGDRDETPSRDEPVQISTAETVAGEYERLGISPTPDSGERLGESMPWDETARPHRPESGDDVTYSQRGREVGKHLIDVHDHLRAELTELRSVVAQVRDGELGASDARDLFNRMALRQNDWTLGAFCSRYCRAVTAHHNLEDVAVFPHLRRAEPGLEPVIDQLTAEHHAIGDAIEEVDRALIHHLENPSDFTRLQAAIDALTDALLSHLSYEEHELVEPLARVGFAPGQV